MWGSIIGTSLRMYNFSSCFPSPFLQKSNSSVAPPSAFEINASICWILLVLISAGTKSFRFSIAMRLLVLPFVNFSLLAKSAIKYSDWVITPPSSPARIMILVPTAVLGSAATCCSLGTVTEVKTASISDCEVAWLRWVSKSPFSWHSVAPKSQLIF